MHLLEGLALLELNRPGESSQAFTDALSAADGLLALADRNVDALEVRALALSGLAVVAGDPARAAEAAEAFAQARAVTTAPGVVPTPAACSASSPLTTRTACSPP
jgi:hypothetical protein